MHSPTPNSRQSFLRESVSITEPLQNRQVREARLLPSPSAANTLVDQAKRCWANGQYKEAATLFEQALEVKPRGRLSAFAATCWMLHRDPEEAERASGLFFKRYLLPENRTAVSQAKRVTLDEASGTIHLMQVLSNVCCSHALSLHNVADVSSENGYRRTPVAEWLKDIKPYTKHYRPNERSLQILASLSSIVAARCEACKDADLIVPIPCSTNSANRCPLDIATLMSKFLNIPLAEEGALKRDPAPEPMKSIKSYVQRKQMIDQTMHSYTRLVQGRSVILVDDVCENGTTLNEACRSLLTAGAKSVSAFVTTKTLSAS